MIERWFNVFRLDHRYDLFVQVFIPRNPDLWDLQLAMHKIPAMTVHGRGVPYGVR